MENCICIFVLLMIFKNDYSKLFKLYTEVIFIMASDVLYESAYFDIKYSS